jgi:hypothetical protein
MTSAFLHGVLNARHNAEEEAEKTMDKFDAGITGTTAADIDLLPL